jgi:hypothetical protein
VHRGAILIPDHEYKEWFVQARFPGHEHVVNTDGVSDKLELLGNGYFRELLEGYWREQIAAHQIVMPLKKRRIRFFVGSAKRFATRRYGRAPTNGEVRGENDEAFHWSAMGTGGEKR